MHLIKQLDFYKPTPAYRKLSILSLINRDPTLSQNQIAEKLDFAVSSVNKFFREFEEEDLIQKAKSGYKLTGKGIKKLHRLHENYLQELEHLSNRKEAVKDAFSGFEEGAQKINVGIIKSLGTMIPLIARERGLFDSYELDCDIQTYHNGIELIDDFLDAHIDFAYMGLTHFLREKGLKRGIDVLAACNTGGHALLVKEKTNIKKEEDLIDKTILITPEGTVTHSLFDLLVKRIPGLKNNVNLETSITPENMPYAVEFNDKVDGMLIWEPYVSQAELQFDDLKVFLDFDKYWEERIGRHYLTNVLVGRQTSEMGNFATDKILQIHHQIIEFVNQNPKEANRIMANKLNLPIKVIENARKRVHFKSQLEWGNF